MSVFKMVVLLCSLTATPNLNDCNEKTAVSVGRLAQVAPYAERCEHDSQHEQMQLLYKDMQAAADKEKDDPAKKAAVDKVRADRKIKVLCTEVPQK